MSKYTVYLANAMTNIPAFNFPWFFEAEEWLLENTHVTDVKNPARKDLEKIPLEVMQTIPGYDTGDLPTYVANSSFTMGNAMEWDLPAIKASKGIVLGDRWPTSTGARYERIVAEAMERDIWLLHGESASDFELVKEDRPTLLTDFLRQFPTPGAASLVAGATLEVAPPLTASELVDLLHERIGHVPGMAHRIEQIRAGLA